MRLSRPSVWMVWRNCRRSFDRLRMSGARGEGREGTGFTWMNRMYGMGRIIGCYV